MWEWGWRLECEWGCGGERSAPSEPADVIRAGDGRRAPPPAPAEMELAADEDACGAETGAERLCGCAPGERECAWAWAEGREGGGGGLLGVSGMSPEKKRSASVKSSSAVEAAEEGGEEEKSRRRRSEEEDRWRREKVGSMWVVR